MRNEASKLQDAGGLPAAIETRTATKSSYSYFLHVHCSFVVLRPCTSEVVNLLVDSMSINFVDLSRHT